LRAEGGSPYGRIADTLGLILSGTCLVTVLADEWVRDREDDLATMNWFRRGGVRSVVNPERLVLIVSLVRADLAL
jgi:hypothetical protein